MQELHPSGEAPRGEGRMCPGLSSEEERDKWKGKAVLCELCKKFCEVLIPLF